MISVTAWVLAAAIGFGTFSSACVTLPEGDPNNPNNPSTPPVTVSRPWIDGNTQYKVADANTTDILGFDTNTTKVSQIAEYLNTNVPRNIPTETSNFGSLTGLKDSEMPIYNNGSNKPTTYKQILALKEEARIINATGTRTDYSTGMYDALDADGNLLKDGEKVVDADGNVRKLFKHTSAQGMYCGNVSDDEPAISKKLTYLSRTGREANQLTGLYAPAGEVVKIEMSDADFAATGGLMVYIGQVYPNGQLVGMEWTNPTNTPLNQFTDSTPVGIKGGGYRMYYICNTYQLKTATAYVGSFIGGPIYVCPVKNNVSHKFSVTITGGVRYQHYILGSTTPEEYAENAKSSAPYFDLEVYDNLIRFSGSNIYVKGKTFAECTKAAVLWEKIALTSTRVQNAGNADNVPIVAIFDCYIAAGAAYANPGRNGIVCPIGWMTGALNYDSFVRSGDWGTMHEYNHCWQSYGFPGGSEVVNNGTTLVSYMLYTNISSSRAINKSLGGWNRLTDPAWALSECLSKAEETPDTPFSGISLYASLLYNIGAENYINSARGGRENKVEVYLKNLTNNVKADFTWFLKDVLHYPVGSKSEDSKALDSQIIPQAVYDEIKNKNYPVYVPVSSVYAVARSMEYDGKYQDIKVAQPFEYTSYASNGEYVMDFGNRNNFAQGELKNTGLVIPDGFTVKVKSVTQPQNGSVEMLSDNNVKYTPSEGAAYSGEFKVTLEIKKNDDAFKVNDVVFTVNLKRSNYINRTTYIYEDAQKVPAYNALLGEDKKFNFGSPSESESIAHINSTQNCNTDIWNPHINYYDANDTSSADKQRSLPIGKVLQTVSGTLYMPEAGTYKISVRGRGKIALYLSYDNGETWELAVDANNPSNNGTDWMKDVELKEFAEGGKTVMFKEVLQVASNRNFCGLGIAKKQADGTYPNPSFLNAYNSEKLAQVANQPFKADYYFTRTYDYTYENIKTYNETNLDAITVLSDTCNKAYPSKNIFDNNLKTVGLSNTVLDANNPAWEVTVDLGKNISAHTLDLYSWVYSGKNQTPNDFTLYLGATAEDLKEVASTDKIKVSGTTATVTFERQEFRYFKLVVRKSVDNHFAAIAGILFKDGDLFENGTLVSPDNVAIKYTGNNLSVKSELCTFGHVYLGQEKDFVEFKFSGERVAYFAYQSKDYGSVDVYIDGALVVKDKTLNSEKNESGIVFISDKLTSGEHTIAIVCKSGKFNVDSFAYWSGK